MLAGKNKSLNHQLRGLLSTINDLARITDIISINASISASRMPTAEGRAFKEIAKEIRSISSTTLTNLEHLDDLLVGVKNLSFIINLAGKQRMLAQKAMKTQLLSMVDEDHREGHLKDLQLIIGEFERAHDALVSSEINTQGITDGLLELAKIWNDFKQSLVHANVSRSNELNTEVVTRMNKIVGQYQELGG